MKRQAAGAASEPVAEDQAVTDCVANFLHIASLVTDRTKYNVAVATHPRASEDLFQRVVGEVHKENAALVPHIQVLRLQQAKSPPCAAIMSVFIASTPRGREIAARQRQDFNRQLGEAVKPVVSAAEKFLETHDPDGSIRRGQI